MANYIVTNNSNSGEGSLRRAVAEANANPGLDNIVFEVIDVKLDSAILITDALEITGNGAVITQTKSDRLFNINDRNPDTLIDVTFDNLKLTGGKQVGFGGAINTLENLTLNKITLENNVAMNRGGAIRVKDAKLTVKDSLIRENSLTQDSLDNAGTAIYIDGGSFQLEDSSFEDHPTKFSAIAIDNSSGTLTNSSVMNNQGLGFLVSEESSLEISQSNISNNSNGGVIVEADSKLTLSDSSVNNNQATSGAGIALKTASEAEILDSIIIGNIAEVDGGGLKVEGDSNVTLRNTTIELNEAPIGSAISLIEGSSAFLMDTTIIDNTGSDRELEGDDFTIETTPIVTPEEASLDLTNVHRFYQYERGFHLYTSDLNEISVIREQGEAGTLPYNYEAEQFTVLAENKDVVTGAIIEGAKPVYRFFNTATGSHLYTMDENERSFIAKNLDYYNAEGIQYYAFEEQPENIETVPVFRLFNGVSGSHLFTIDQNEVNFIKDNLPQFSVEGDSGIAYHVFDL